MKKSMKKTLAILLAVVLLIGAVVGGTLAWFTDETESIKNTFTVGNIDIDLKETKVDFKMIPGWTIAKDPKASVEAGSEDCYLFVEITSNKEIEKSATTEVYSVGDYLEYQVAAGWTAVPDETNVFYRVVKKVDAVREFSVLLDDQVKVKDTVTKQMMDAIKDETVEEPTLTFTAYAVQLYKNNTDKFTAAEAWAIAKPTT